MAALGVARCVQIFVLSGLFSLVLSDSSVRVKHGARSPPIFVFGASLVDMGQNAAALPFHSYSEFPPYGMDFFGKPAKRFSNGRLFVDFISEALGQEYLHPYLSLQTGVYEQGVNFASSGSTATNSTLSGARIFNGLFEYTSNGIFSLLVQVDQFRIFKSAVEEANAEGRKTPLSNDDFSKAVYILETANNDYLAYGYQSQDLYANDLVTSVLQSMEQSLKVLYEEGARKVIVLNLLPLGCMPIVLGKNLGTGDALDHDGCVSKFNELSALHNKNLEPLIARLNSELAEPGFFVFDIYRIFMDAITNPSAHGLQHVLISCCGYGGEPYNYSDEVHCGGFGYVDGVLRSASTCEDPSTYLFWDSFHPTETFNRRIADAFLSGDYMQPRLVIRGNTCEGDRIQ